MHANNLNPLCQFGAPTPIIHNIGCQEWFDAINLKWSHKDPVDRLLVAYANDSLTAVAKRFKNMKMLTVGLDTLEWEL